MVSHILRYTGDEPDHQPLVIHADPTNNDAKMKLAEILEILNEPRKALDLVLQGIAVSWSRACACTDRPSYPSYRLPQTPQRTA